MVNELSQVEHDALEALIDRYNLAAVLETIADVCDDKAQHIQENWQDTQFSRDWVNASWQVQKAAIHPTVKAVSL